MGCIKCARCCQEFSYELNKDELWVKKLVKFLEIMRLHSLLKIVKEVKIIMRCKYLDENKLCKIYDKRPKRCREFLCQKAKEVEMFAKYICVGCGITWRSKEILVICPVCRSKTFLIKNIKVGEIIGRGRYQLQERGLETLKRI